MGRMRFAFSLTLFLCLRPARSDVKRQDGGCPPFTILQRGMVRGRIVGQSLSSNDNTIQLVYENATMEVNCTSGFTPLNHAYANIKCVKKDDSFKWQGELPTCVENICRWNESSADVEFAFRGRVLDFFAQERLFPEDTRVKYVGWPECPESHRLIMNEKICLKNKTWGGSQPECVDLKSPPIKVALVWPLVMSGLLLLAFITIFFLLCRTLRPQRDNLLRGISQMSHRMSRYLTSSVRYFPRPANEMPCIHNSVVARVDGSYETIGDTRFANINMEPGPSRSNQRTEAEDEPPSYAKVVAKSERKKQSSMKKNPS